MTEYSTNLMVFLMIIYFVDGRENGHGKRRRGGTDSAANTLALALAAHGVTDVATVGCIADSDLLTLGLSADEVARFREVTSSGAEAERASRARLELVAVASRLPSQQNSFLVAEIGIEARQASVVARLHDDGGYKTSQRRAEMSGEWKLAPAFPPRADEALLLAPARITVGPCVGAVTMRSAVVMVEIDRFVYGLRVQLRGVTSPHVQSSATWRDVIAGTPSPFVVFGLSSGERYRVVVQVKARGIDDSWCDLPTDGNHRNAVVHVLEKDPARGQAVRILGIGGDHPVDIKVAKDASVEQWPWEWA